ncbi:MAG: hypothetical protein ABFS46_17655, partial [Myxococcota bacterium]
MRPLNRITPAAPAHAYQTYEVISPIATHFNEASCSEADCAAQANGWQTFVDESTPLGQRQAHYIRRISGRGFTEEFNENGVTVFTFGAGQECFTTHQVRSDRPEVYLVGQGDWRRRYGRAFQHD